MQSKFWKNKKVLITGNTGFKGSWLSLFLYYLGADLYGVSLKSNKKELFYKLANLKKVINTNFFDINKFYKLKNYIKKINPDIIFHLAAQPLVIESYKDPLKTYQTNIIGTANLLEAIKNNKRVKAVLLCASDKVYLSTISKNFNETDILGGKDPYSASKASAEILSNFYINFYKNKKSIFTVRSGNVLGGGDFAKNRIMKDISESIFKKKKLLIRNLNSTRPWQFISDTIFSYIKLCELIYNDKKKNGNYNVGPVIRKKYSVFDIIKFSKKKYKFNYKVKKNFFYETEFLGLNSNKVNNLIKFKKKYGFKKTIAETLQWYDNYHQGKDMFSYSLQHVKYYLNEKK